MIDCDIFNEGISKILTVNKDEIFRIKYQCFHDIVWAHFLYNYGFSRRILNASVITSWFYSNSNTKLNIILPTTKIQHLNKANNKMEWTGLGTYYYLLNIVHLQPAQIVRM